MPTTEHEDNEAGLPPPGSRWGAGAHSVLPYLTKSLQAKPASAPEHGREARGREPHPAQAEGSTASPA